MKNTRQQEIARAEKITNRMARSPKRIIEMVSNLELIEQFIKRELSFSKELRNVADLSDYFYTRFFYKQVLKNLDKLGVQYSKTPKLTRELKKFQDLYGIF